MQLLPPAKWVSALERVSQRYAGRSVIMRQQLPDEDEPHLVLWRTPLRHVGVAEAAELPSLLIVAGHEEPFIEVPLESVERITLQVAADQSLDLLRFDLADGTVAVLAFNHFW